MKEAAARINGIAMVHATNGGMEQRKFPLPPSEMQKETVAEIEGYQDLIAANRELVTRFEKNIQATVASVWGSLEKREEAL